MEIQKYVKKPVVIQAIKLENNTESIRNCLEFVYGKNITGGDVLYAKKSDGINITTLEGVMHASWVTIL